MSELNEQLREVLGKAAFDMYKHDGTPWEELHEGLKENWRKTAEKLISQYRSWTDEHAEGYLRIAGVEEDPD